jgi:adhesin/invasin
MGYWARLLLTVGLALGVLGVVGPGTAVASGNLVTVTPTIAVIAADGSSTTTVTVNVTNAGNPVTGDTIQLTSSGGQVITPTSGPMTDQSGNWTATLQSTTMPGPYTLTASDMSSGDTGIGTITQWGIGVTLSSPTVPADGTSTMTATAVEYDASGNPVNGSSTVAFQSTAFLTSVPASATGSPGTYSAGITSTTTLGQFQISASDSSTGFVSPNPQVPYTQTFVLPYRFTIQLGTNVLPDDGTSATSVTATVTDHIGHPVPNEAIDLSPAGGPAGGQVISPSTGSTDASGSFIAQVTASSFPGQSSINGQDTSSGLFASAPLVQSGIGVTLSRTTVPADGVTPFDATVTEFNTNGSPVTGSTVTLHSNDAAQPTSIATLPGTPGNYSATLTSTLSLAQSFLLTATDTTTHMTSPAAVYFQTLVQPYQLSVSPAASSIPADGVSQESVQVSLLDAVGHAVQNAHVTFADPADPGVTFSPASPATDANGVATTILTSSLSAGSTSIKATAAGVSGSAPLLQTLRPAGSIALSLSPSRLVAGTAGTASITLLDPKGQPLTGDANGIRLSASDPHLAFGTIVDTGSGHYTVGFVTSGTAQAVTITATEAREQISASQILSQLHGPAHRVALTLSPNVITADGISATTATVIVTDGNGNPVSGDPVHLKSSGVRVKLGPVKDGGNGTYTATVTASNMPGTPAITASDGALSDSAQLHETAAPSLVNGVVNQWRFAFAPRYTVVQAMNLSGAPLGGTIKVICKGGGCPFRQRNLQVVKHKPCPKGKKHKPCQATGSFNLAALFTHHRLKPGAKVIVEVLRRGWIGKYYVFRVRSAKGPSIGISCLAPGGVNPGVGCQ